MVSIDAVLVIRSGAAAAVVVISVSVIDGRSWFAHSRIVKVHLHLVAIQIWLTRSVSHHTDMLAHCRDTHGRVPIAHHHCIHAVAVVTVHEVITVHHIVVQVAVHVVHVVHAVHAVHVVHVVGIHVSKVSHVVHGIHVVVVQVSNSTNSIHAVTQITPVIIVVISR